LLIVLFILALIAGFVVVLMGGAGSLFGNRSSSPSSVVETSTPSSTPSAKPTTAVPAQDPVAAAPGTEPVTKPSSSQPDTTKPFPTPEPNSSTPAPATANGSTPADAVKPDPVPVIPAQTAKPSSSTPSPSTPETKPAAATPTVETVPVRPAPRVETTPAQPVVKPTVETAPAQSAPRVETAPAQPTVRPAVRTPRVQASGSGVPTKSDYRISAGLYSSSAAAEDVASKIRGLGYPVHVVPSKDDTEVVLVGPFGNRRDANAASGDISRVHQNLFVYAPSSDSASNSASSSDNPSISPNTSTAGDPNSSTPATTPKVDSGSSTLPSDTPASGTLYLQVGAFGSQSSADTLIEKLRSSGYSPRTRIGSSGLVRVVVGPFAAAEIDAAKSKLSSEGVDSFTVRSN